MSRFLRLPEVLHMVGLSRSGLYRLMASGEFPLPIKLTTRAVGWRESDVHAWMSSRSRTLYVVGTATANVA